MNLYAIHNSNQEKPKEIFYNFILPLYTDENVGFTILNNSNVVITSQFKEDTYESFRKNNLQYIYDYYIENVSKIERVDVPKLRTLDVTKTVAYNYTKENATSTTSYFGTYPYVRTIGFTAYMTIYYNPNTSIISDNSGYLVDNTYYSNGAEVLYLSSSGCVGEIAANGYSVLFSMSAKFCLDANEFIPRADWLVFTSSRVYSD